MVKIIVQTDIANDVILFKVIVTCINGSVILSFLLTILMDLHHIY